MTRCDHNHSKLVASARFLTWSISPAHNVNFLASRSNDPDFKAIHQPQDSAETSAQAAALEKRHRVDRSAVIIAIAQRKLEIPKGWANVLRDDEKAKTEASILDFTKLD